MNKDINFSLLDMIEYPAFCVQENVVIQANQPAQQLLILEGANIADILKDDYAVYQEFTNGYLYLSITISGVRHSTSVSKMDGFDFFLLQNEDAKLQAFALASSQLRIPFNDVMLAVDQLTAEQALQGPHSEALHKGLNQMHRMLCNMSDAGRYRTGADAHLELTNLTVFFRELMESLAQMVQLTGHTLQYTGLQTPYYAMADCVMLERAVSNLLTNAIKFSPEHSTITAKLVQANDILRFTLQDQGERMPENARHNLFNHYLRSPGTSERQGLGLGLPLVAAIASIHGGTAMVDFPGERGTRVSFTIRQYGAADTQVRSPVKLPRSDYAGGRDRKLLEFSEVLPADAFAQ